MYVSLRIYFVFLLFFVTFCERPVRFSSKNILFRHLYECNVGGPVLGWEGKCANYTIADFEKYMPDKANATWIMLKNFINETLPSGLKGCLGDFSVKTINEDAIMKDSLCYKFPFAGDRKYAIASIHLPDLPCGVPIAGKPSPVKASMCVAFDQCGTFAFSTNLGASACIASYAGSAETAGLTTLIATFNDVVKSFGYGFSLDRDFEKDVVVGVLSGDAIVDKVISAKASAYFALALGPPTDFLKFSEKLDLSKVLDFNANFIYLVDFGNVKETLAIIKRDLETVKEKEAAKAVVKNVISLGKEIVTSTTGTLNINLKKYTRGIIPDISITLNNVPSILTRGRSADLPAGYYFTASSDLVGDLSNTIKGFVEAYWEIFELLGFKKFEVPIYDLYMNFFITTENIGIKSVFPGFELTCLFRWSGYDLSCSLNSKIFTMIVEGAEYVFKEAEKFFEKTGRIIKAYTKEAFEAITDTISEGVKKLRGLIDIGGDFINVTSEKFKDLIEELKRKAKENIIDEVVRKAKEVAAAAKRVAEEAAEAAANAAKEAAAAAARAAEKAAKWTAKKSKQAWCYSRYFYSSSKRDKCLKEVDEEYKFLLKKL